MDDPTPPLIDDAVNLATLDLSKKSIARMVAWKFFKYVWLIVPALPAWIGMTGTPVIAQARPVEVQPMSTAETAGSVEVEMEAYTVSVGASPNVVQVSTGDLMTIGELATVEISTTDADSTP